MPKTLLGICAALHMPETVPDDQIPPEFRRGWPGLAVFKSRLTGKLIFSGMLPRQGSQPPSHENKIQQNHPLLAFTATGAEGHMTPNQISLSHEVPRTLAPAIEPSTWLSGSPLVGEGENKESTDSTLPAAAADIADAQTY